jgi:hypothetical protein
MAVATSGYMAVIINFSGLVPTRRQTDPRANRPGFLELPGYEQAIKRVFADKYHDKVMAVYRGREDNTIHAIASLRHYVHQIASPNEDTLEFVSSVGDCVTVKLTDDERRELLGQLSPLIQWPLPPEDGVSL